MQNNIGKPIFYMIVEVKLLAFWTKFMPTIYFDDDNKIPMDSMPVHCIASIAANYTCDR